MDFAIIPASWAPKVQAVFRIVVGLLFLEHGTGKIFGFPTLTGLDQMPHGLLLFTGFMELIGGALIVVDRRETANPQKGEPGDATQNGWDRPTRIAAWNRGMARGACGGGGRSRGDGEFGPGPQLPGPVDEIGTDVREAYAQGQDH